MLEPIRVVSDWLGDEDFGVSPVLAVCPLDSGDTRPSAPSVVNEADTEWVAGGEVPEDVRGPLLAVSLAEPIDFGTPPKEAIDGRLQFDWEAKVAIRYVVRGKGRSQGTRDAYYVLRAARASLSLLNLSFPEAASARDRNGVRVERVTEVSMTPPSDAPGDAFVMAGLVATLRCHDTTPTVA